MYDDGMGGDYIDSLDVSEHSNQSDDEEPTVPFELPPIEEDIRPMVGYGNYHGQLFSFITLPHLRFCCTLSIVQCTVYPLNMFYLAHFFMQQTLGEKMERRQPGVFPLKANESVQALVACNVFGRWLGWITFTGEQSSRCPERSGIQVPPRASTHMVVSRQGHPQI